ncbi:MAG: MEKHLA domain-containing protein [Gammaproteobacteria bacterium]|nr:MEKHLA domain-containing protein [Gammaproteobacteria bacterium]
MFQDKHKPSDKNHFHSAHVELLVSSFELFTGKNIFPPEIEVNNVSRELFFAPFVVMSHGTETDPVFNYANQCALDLFEITWENFIKLPSRYSAEADSQDERERILQQVAKNGYADDYTGVRISNKGRRFQIKNATVWNIIDQGRCYGQAALIRNWAYL